MTGLAFDRSAASSARAVVRAEEFDDADALDRLIDVVNVVLRNSTPRLQLLATSGERQTPIVCIGDDSDVKLVAVRRAMCSLKEGSSLQVLSSEQASTSSSVCVCIGQQREIVHHLQTVQLAPVLKRTGSKTASSHVTNCAEVTRRVRDRR